MNGEPTVEADPDPVHLRVMVADDHTLFRDGSRALLTSASDLRLVGEAATGDEILVLTIFEDDASVFADVRPGAVTC